jgi:hypothetical protein
MLPSSLSPAAMNCKHTVAGQHRVIIKHQPKDSYVSARAGVLDESWEDCLLSSRLPCSDFIAP